MLFLHLHLCILSKANCSMCFLRTMVLLAPCSTSTRQWLTDVTGTQTFYRASLVIAIKTFEWWSFWSIKGISKELLWIGGLAQTAADRKKRTASVEKELRIMFSCMLQPVRRLKSTLKSMWMEIFWFPQTTKLASYNDQSPQIIFCITEGKCFL